MTRLKAACIQANSGPDIEANIGMLTALIRQAHAQGADLIVTPESVDYIRSPSSSPPEAYTESDHPLIQAFTTLAKELKIWLLAGSVTILSPTTKPFNRSLLISPEGEIAARYNKIHLFDFTGEGAEVYRESAQFEHGRERILAQTPWGPLGLSICYDVRFAALYRVLAQAGANIITVPSAFTVPTGEAHWHVLLRARAIETGCYILAPAQTGVHQNGRRTYGHSLIISPWGEIVADAGVEVGIITAELDLQNVSKVRQALPSLQHDQQIIVPGLSPNGDKMYSIV